MRGSADENDVVILMQTSLDRIQRCAESRDRIAASLFQTSILLEKSRVWLATNDEVIRGWWWVVSMRNRATPSEDRPILPGRTP
jgi:hypothetical protein